MESKSTTTRGHDEVRSFATFDDRGLPFLYQQQKASGEDSTVFKVIRE